MTQTLTGRLSVCVAAQAWALTQVRLSLTLMLTGVALDCVRFWRLSLPLLLLLASLTYLSQHHRLQRNRRRKANRVQDEEEEEEWVRWALDLFSSERWRERVYGWFKQIFKVSRQTQLAGQWRD